MDNLYRKSRSYLTGFVCGLIIGFCTITFAANITSPPPLRDLPVTLQTYLKHIYDNFGVLEVVTSNPDGSRNGQKGEMLLLQTGGNSYLQINSDGSTTWLGVVLSDTP